MALRALSVGLVLLLAAPSFAGDARRSAVEAVPTAQLPRTGIVYDAPKDAFVVGIAADGTLLVNDQEAGLAELHVALRTLARVPALLEADGSVRANIVLRASVDVPWQVVQWVMQACALQKCWRLHFAVRPEAGGEEGVLDAFLPRDRGIPRDGAPSPAAPALRASLFADDASTDPGAIFTMLRTLVEGAGATTVSIDTPPPNVPRAGHVVTLVDLARRAGARRILFTGAALPFPPFPAARGPGRAGEGVSLAQLRAWVAERTRTLARGVKVKVGKAVVAPSADGKSVPLPPPPPRGKEIPASEAGADEPPLEEETEEVLAKPPTLKDPEAGEPGGEGMAAEPEEAPEDGLLSAGGGSPHAYVRRTTRARATDPAEKRTNEAVEAGLRWLAAHQAPDGSFMAEAFPTWCDGKQMAAPTVDGQGKALYDVGTTGLALLAFLGAGYTNRSEGPFGPVVARGLRYLKNAQDPEGCFGPRQSAHYIYNHGIAALAMVEAYGMTGSTIYKNPAQKALDFVALARNPYFAWRYGVKPGDNDTSVTAWMFDVLEAARRVNAAGTAAGKPASLIVDEEAFEGVEAWLDKMTDEWGRVGYQLRGSGVARSTELVDRFPADRVEGLTGFGVFARVAMGADPATSEPVRKGLRLVAAVPPAWETNGSIDLYSWRLCALAMASVGGEPAAAWRKALLTALLEHQRTDGDLCGGLGSWDPIDPWSPDGGRVYSTSMALLALLAPYSWEPPAPKPK